MGVTAVEPVRSVDIDALDMAGGNRIPQALQRRAKQDRTTVACTIQTGVRFDQMIRPTIGKPVIPMRDTNAHTGKSRGQLLPSGFPPCDRMPGTLWQGQRKLLDRGRFVLLTAAQQLRWSPMTRPLLSSQPRKYRLHGQQRQRPRTSDQDNSASDRPATSATTTAAPIWSARGRSGRSPLQQPTMLTVLTQTPAFRGASPVAIRSIEAQHSAAGTGNASPADAGQSHHF